MSKQEEYYAHKVREIENNKKKQDLAEMTHLALIGGVVVICVVAILFIISPGLLATMLIVKVASFRSSTPVLWGMAALTSVVLVGSIYFFVRNIKKTLVVYFLFCVFSTLSSIYIKDGNSQNIIESVFDRYFWPAQGEKAVASDQLKKVNNIASAPSAVQSPEADIKKNPIFSESQSSATEQKAMPESEGKSVIASEAESDAKPTGPSFSCKSRLLKVEEIVCKDAELSRLDVELSSLYQSKLQQVEDKRQIKSDQLDWIVHSMRKCADRDCLAIAYQNRIDALNTP